MGGAERVHVTVDFDIDVARARRLADLMTPLVLEPDEMWAGVITVGLALWESDRAAALRLLTKTAR